MGYNFKPCGSNIKMRVCFKPAGSVFAILNIVHVGTVFFYGLPMYIPFSFLGIYLAYPALFRFKIVPYSLGIKYITALVKLWCAFSFATILHPMCYGYITIN